MRLAGMKSVVTGGASGIGAATARRFAAEGAQVCILDRDVATAQALAEELELSGMKEKSSKKVLIMWSLTT